MRQQQPPRLGGRYRGAEQIALHLGAAEDIQQVPLLFGFDVIHGLRTIFPVPIGMAASWDPDAIERAQSVAAREARAVGIHWTFAPMCDISNDIRWGRVMEGAGEDPWLGSLIARAMVRGYQGDGLDKRKRPRSA